MSDLKRIFVAVDISEDARGKVGAYIRGLRESFPDAKCRWVAPDNLHVTCWFLGNVDEEQLANCRPKVDVAAREIAPFTVELKGSGKFSQRRQFTDILWIGVMAEPAERFNDIVRSFREETTFKPHLTIGRLKNSRHGSGLVDTHLSQGFAPVRFVVNELVIYESELTPTGSKYHPVYRAVLGV